MRTSYESAREADPIAEALFLVPGGEYLRPKRITSPVRKSVSRVSEPSKPERKRGLPDLGNPLFFRHDPMRADAVRCP